MVRAAVTRFHVAAGKEGAFERFMRSAMRQSVKFKGQLGAIFLRSLEEPSAYLMVAFWRTRADRVAYLKATGSRQKARTFTTGTPQTEWFDTVARLQAAKLAPSR